MSEGLEPSIIRLHWSGGGPHAAVTLSMRHYQRPLTSQEIYTLAEVVKAIEDFRELVSDPEGLEAGS